MSYRDQLKERNISQSIQNFIYSRVASDIDITLRCALTKTIVKVPIRHRMLISINCVFELEEWILFRQSKQNEQLNECPGCKAKVAWEFYGIDYQLLNVISLMRFKDPTEIQFKQDKLRFQSRRNLYYAFSKQDPKQLIKLPGGREIINPKLQISSNSPINDQLTQSLIKFQQILVWKKIQQIEKKNRMDLNDANQRLEKVVGKVEAVFKKNNRLIEIGKESMKNNNQFVFALRQIYKEDYNYSVLVVYYPSQNIWLDFDLMKPDGTPYVQLDGVLYIKDGSQQNQNVIYLAGGNITRYEQTNEFYKIVFPKDPMTDVKELKMERLPNLVKKGYNFMGTIYQGKIYIFYGQRRIINQQTQQVTDELLSCAFVFKNNTWYDLNIELLPRFDGSYFIHDHPQEKRCVFFYGGVPKNLDGLVAYATQGVEQSQIFLCEKEQLLGKAQNITFPFAKSYPQCKLSEKNVINSPIFSIPYYSEYQLLISGQYMKEQFLGKRQIYTYNWAANHIYLNEVLSMAPPEQILTPSQGEGRIFTPVVDQMGTLYHNIFYTIYQYEDQNKEIQTELLKINLATGEFLTQVFQNREQCQQDFNKTYQRLVLDKDRIIV